MRIAVFARPVHNQALPVKPGDVQSMQELEGYCPVPNPQDEYALEYALRLKDRYGVHVTVVSVGGNACEAVLREFLACGADHAVWLEERAWEPGNGMIAQRIAEYCHQNPFDLGLFGLTDADTRSGEVGPMVAALADIPFVGPVIGLQWDSKSVLVSIKVRKATERVRLSFPACLGILRGEPLRYPSFFGRLRAEQMALQRLQSPVSRIPHVARIRFTQPKPQKRSVASTGREVSSQKRIEQALGLALKGGDRASSLLKGEPVETAQKALELIRKENLLPES